jgi:hypothetical protein
MKRLAIKLVLFLLLGAIVNVAVAWGCAAFLTLEIVGFGPREDMWTLWQRYATSTKATPNVVIQSQRAFGVEWNATSCFNTRLNLHTDVRECVAGFPCTALRGGTLGKRLSFTTRGLFTAKHSSHKYEREIGCWRIDFGPPQWVYSPLHTPTKDRLIPFVPVWPGFVINTILYAAVLWVVFATPGLIKRTRRRMLRGRGCCIHCGYDLRGQPADSKTCPECGRSGPIKGLSRQCLTLATALTALAANGCGGHPPFYGPPRSDKNLSAADIEWVIARPDYVPTIRPGITYEEFDALIRHSAELRAQNPDRKSAFPKGASYQPPQHLFTIPDSGSTLSAFSVRVHPFCSPLIYVFRDLRLEKVVKSCAPYYHRTFPHDLREIRAQGDKLRPWLEKARGTLREAEPLSDEQVASLSIRQIEADRSTHGALEPGILLLFPHTEGDEHRRYLSVMTRYNVSDIEIASSVQHLQERWDQRLAVLDDDDGVLAVFGESTETGWYGTPIVWVWHRDGRVRCILTTYHVPWAESVSQDASRRMH